MGQELGAAARIGETIAGKYLLKRVLGSGGMGAVYEAEHQFTRRTVAVKLMHPHFARSKLAAERFIREAQAPSTIGHPGIIEVLDGGYHVDGSLYLVLELLEGETLTQAVRERRFSPTELCELAAELLDALDAAHQAGFVHRDIKPDNIFLEQTDSDDPRVKLLDFGVAGLLEPSDKPGLTAHGVILGTPLYMSPEQARGRPSDARSDLWSVGAVLYEMLSGRAPYGGETFSELVVSIITKQHAPLHTLQRSLPTGICQVVERALRKEPGTRWESAEEMADALRAALSSWQHGMSPDAARAVSQLTAASAARMRRRRTTPDAAWGSLSCWPLWCSPWASLLSSFGAAGGPRCGLPRVRRPRAMSQRPTKTEPRRPLRPNRSRANPCSRRLCRSRMQARERGPS